MVRSKSRPPSVWITQVLLLPALVILPLTLLVSLFQCVFAQTTQSCLSPPSLTTWVMVFCGFVFVLLTFWGLQQRQQYGRGLAVILWLMAFVGQLTQSSYLQLIYRSVAKGQSLPAPPYECWEKTDAITSTSCGYSSYAELAFQVVLNLLLASIYGLLAIRLISSPAVKRFFNRSKEF